MKKQTFSKTTLSLAIAISVGSLASQAIAQNNVVAKNELMSEKTTTVNGNLVELGTPQNSLNLKGFAKDLPLIAVLKQITPNEWLVKKAKGKTLDLQKPVSWTGGKNWVETLRDIVEKNKVEAVVNWDKKEVVLAEIEVKSPTTTVMTEENKKAVVKSTQSTGIFELATDVVAEGNSGQKIETNEMVKNESVTEIKSEPTLPPPVLVKSWTFEGMDNLKEVVNSWAKKAGYKLVYTGENYPIDKEDPRTFGGEFDGEDGPIKQLSVDYGKKSRVKKPLSFIFYQNKTLLVEDLRYEQSGYPQYIQNNQ